MVKPPANAVHAEPAIKSDRPAFPQGCLLMAAC